MACHRTRVCVHTHRTHPPSINVFPDLSVCLSVYLSVCLSACLSVPKNDPHEDGYEGDSERGGGRWGLTIVMSSSENSADEGGSGDGVESPHRRWWAT